MGRSNNTEIANPAERFIRWDGGDGQLSYWDKTGGELDEKGEPTGIRVEVPLPFNFLVLESMTKIGGGTDDGDKYVQFYSNFVLSRDLKNAIFTVRSKQRGVEVRGSYEEVKAYGGKFVTSLFIGYLDENKQLVVATLDLKGAAVSAWIDFTKNVKDIYAGGFKITGSVKKKKGKVDYYEPVFERTAVPERIDTAATSLHADVILPYLAAYFSNDMSHEEHGEPIGDANGWSGPPPEMTRAAVAGAEAGADDVPFNAETGDENDWS